MFNLELLKALCLLDSVTGFEEELQAFIKEKITPFADDVKTDALGNVIAYKKGKHERKNKLLVLCPVDEPGLIIKAINKNGHLTVSPLGNISADEIACKAVKVGRNKLNGVIGTVPVHMLKADDRKKAVSLDDLSIDIGACSKEQAKKYVNLGDYVTFDDDFSENYGRILGKSVDTKACCAVLLELLKEELMFDCCFAFTTQSRLSANGAKVAAYSVGADCALILDGAASSGIVKADESVPALKKGAVVPFLSDNCLYNSTAVNTICKTAKESNIDYQYVKREKDTIAKVISTAREGIKCAAVNIPCRYKNSISRVIDIYDCECALKLMSRLVNMETRKSIFKF